MNKTAVVLTTYSAYWDVCQNFVQLFEKNWDSCEFDFWILMIGDEVQINKDKVIYYDNITLPTAIYLFMEEHNEYDYCISFLGDAFISSKINTWDVNELLNEINVNRIEYCCLIPRIPFRLKRFNCGNYIRYISGEDVYNMCFVAFIASRGFVRNEFSDGISDLEFEMKYLENDADQIYNNRAILTKNVFNIVAGIDAGKWNNHAYNKLKRRNPEIVLVEREHTTFFKTIFYDFTSLLQIFLSKKQRKYLKNFFSSLFNVKFMTKY